MTQYGQFCPIAKASEVLGEKWTLLIIRELIMGGRRFNELQRGLGDISPSLLTKRLKALEEHGLVVRKQVSGLKGYEYYPTPACESLLPSLIALGEWGMLWARDTILDADLDVELLMLYLERSIDPSQLVGDHNIIKFKFTDLTGQQDWWLLVKGDKVDLCLTDPGKDVNVYFTSSLRAMHDVFMGDCSHRQAIADGRLTIEGDPALTRTVPKWLRTSAFANSERAPLRTA